MYSAYGSIRAVAVLMMLSLSGAQALPQAVKFIRHAADPLPLANLPVGRAPCTRDSGSAAASPYAATAASGDPASPCDTPPARVPSMNPCNLAGLAQSGCDAPRDPVHENLAALGKTGQKILRGRDRVL